MKSSHCAAFAIGIALSFFFFVDRGWAGGRGAEVILDHSHVQPARIEIKAGESVIFKNVVDMPGGHTVVADDGSFESPPLNKDQTWTHQFGKPGSYKFHLKQHPNTKGEVVVQ
ncbi:MAG TPA: cupredoxin domain-containing protein [Myxococcota bacterium]|nr:cupredoxin domain-containing protein [Myxococcota bacterium]